MNYVLHDASEDTLEPISIRGTDSDALKAAFKNAVDKQIGPLGGGPIALWSYDSGTTDGGVGRLWALSVRRSPDGDATRHRQAYFLESDDPVRWWKSLPAWVRDRLETDPLQEWDDELAKALESTTGSRVARISPHRDGGVGVYRMGANGIAFVDYLKSLSPARRHALIGDS